MQTSAATHTLRCGGTSPALAALLSIPDAQSRLFVSLASPADDDSGDSLRNAFDVLCSTPPQFGDDEALTAWCSWQPGLGEGKRARGADTAGVPRWADPTRRRKAFSEAWLALLRVELPLDLYKVRGRWHATGWAPD